jgi:hypothetical protein
MTRHHDSTRHTRGRHSRPRWTPPAVKPESVRKPSRMALVAPGCKGSPPRAPGGRVRRGGTGVDRHARSTSRASRRASSTPGPSRAANGGRCPSWLPGEIPGLARKDPELRGQGEEPCGRSSEPRSRGFRSRRGGPAVVMAGRRRGRPRSRPCGWSGRTCPAGLAVGRVRRAPRKPIQTGRVHARRNPPSGGVGGSRKAGYAALTRPTAYRLLPTPSRTPRPPAGPSDATVPVAKTH